MDRKSIERDIRSHERRMESDKKRAIANILDNELEVATLAIACALTHKGAISELMQQLEMLEVEQ